MVKKRMLTGDRPTGKLHLGHYVGSLQNRVKLQKEFDPYIMIADVQALTDHFDRSASIKKYVIAMAKDYLSVGIDPEQTTLFIQSQIPEIAELTLYYLNLVSLAKLARNPTVKHEIQQKGYGDHIPVGFFCYPVNQAADITLFHAEQVPVGVDQLPMIEQTNAIVRRFNRLYGVDFFKECQPILGDVPKLVGIDGLSKASKTLNNTIFLSDDAAVIQQKVFQMYTDPDHIKVSQPGRVQGNVVFTYLDAFHHDPEEVEALKAHYTRGGLGDVTIKHMLNDCLQSFLAPFRAKRNQWTDSMVKEVLQCGIGRAKIVAKETIEAVRDLIGIHYF